MASNDNDILVRARFDGKNFDSGINKSSSALEKFKKSTSFDDQQAKTSKFAAAFQKSISGMQESVNNFSMSNIDLGIGTLGGRLSSGIDGIKNTILGKLDNIISTVKSKFSMIWDGINVEPKSTGFEEYETQINAVQTILANTSSAGKTIDDVMAALNELNTYADMTIYNFTEMTRNIGTFTAAGVDLETSTQAIKGIANLGAISGSTSQQVSTAMYQLSQALAAGRVGLQDWNSVVNAGMGGKIFQDALVKTAENMGKVVDLSSGFRESISATNGESWLTADVLLATLQEFADANSELGKLGTEAATKVKTITQLWDTVKESVQSGWTTTWTTIVGDFEDAKGTLSAVSDAVSDMLSLKANRRNDILDYWANVRQKSEDTAEEVTTNSEEIERVAMEVIRGDWANGQTRFNMLDAAGYDHVAVQRRVDEILGIVTPAAEEVNTALGTGTQTGREMFLEGLSNIGNFLTRLYKTWFTVYHQVFTSARTAAENLVHWSEKFRDFTKIFVLSEAQWLDMRAIIRGLVSILKIAITAVKHVGTMLKTAFQTIDFTALKESIYDLFNIDPTKQTDSLLHILAKIAKKITDFSKAFESAKFTAIFEDLGKSVGYVLQVVVDAITVFTDFLGLPNDVKLEALSDAFGHAKERVQALVDTIKNALQPVLDTISETFTKVTDKLGIDTDKISDAIEKVTRGAKNGLKNVRDFIDSKRNQNGTAKQVEETGEVKPLDTKETLENAVKEDEVTVKWYENITIDKVKTVVDKVASILNTIISVLIAEQGLALIHAFKNFVNTLSDVADSLTGGVGALSGALDELGGVLKAFSFQISASAILTIAIAIAVLALSLKSLAKLDPKDMKNAADAITLLFIGLVGALSATSTAGKNIKASFVAHLSSNIALSVLLMAMALKMLTKVNERDVAKSLTIMGVMVAYIKSIISSLTKLTKAANGSDIESFKGIGSIMTSLALGINMLILPMLILALIPQKALTKGITALGALIGVMLLFVDITAAVVGLTNKSGDDISKTLGKLGLIMLELAAAVNMLMIPLVILSAITADNGDHFNIVGGIFALAVIFAAIAGAIALITVVVKKLGSQQTVMKKLSKILLSYSVTMIAFSASVLLLLPAILAMTALAAVSPEAFTAAMFTLILLMWTITGSISVIIGALSNAKTKKIKIEVIAMIAVTIMALIGGIIGILYAMIPLLTYPVENIAVTFGGIGLLIMTFAAVMAVMGRLKKKIDSMTFVTILTFIGGMAAILYLIKDLKDNQIKAAIKIALISAVFIAAVIAAVNLLNRSNIMTVGDNITNNYNQINKVVQLLLGLGAAMGGLGIMLFGFVKVVDQIVELSSYDAPDLSKGFIAIGKGLMAAIPIFAAVIVEFVTAIVGVIQGINHVGIAAQLFYKFVLVVEAIMALMATGDLIPRFVQFVLQVVIVILYMIAGAIDNIAEAIVIIIIGIVAGVGRALDQHGEELARGIIQIITALGNLVGDIVVALFGEKLAIALIAAIMFGVIAAVMGATTAGAVLLGGLGAIIFYVVSELWNELTKNWDEKTKLIVSLCIVSGIAIAAAIAAGFGIGIKAAPIIIIAALAILVSVLITKFCEWLGIASPSKVFTGFGVNIVQGLVNGIISMVGKAWDAIKEVGSTIAEGFCSFFGINSPSKLMAEYGEYIDEGLANGITDSSDVVVDSLDEVQNGMTDAIDTTVAEGFGEGYAQSVADGIENGQGSVKDATANLTDSVSIDDIEIPKAGDIEMPDVLGEGTFLFDSTFTEPTGSEQIMDSVSDISSQMNESFGENAFDFGGILDGIRENNTTSNIFSNFGEDAGIDMTNGLSKGFNLDSIFGKASESLGEGSAAGGFMDKISSMFSGSGEDASAGFMEGLGPIATDVTSIFSKTGEDSSNGFLSFFSDDGQGNGFTDKLANIFGDAGGDSGTNFLDGLTNTFDDPNATGGFKEKLQELFNSGSSDVETSATVTPVLAMGAQDALNADISSAVDVGTVDVSGDAKLAIENTGLPEQIDKINYSWYDKLQLDKNQHRDIHSMLADAQKSRDKNEDTMNAMYGKMSEIYDEMGNVIYFDMQSVKNMGLTNFIDHMFEVSARMKERQSAQSKTGGLRDIYNSPYR